MSDTAITVLVSSATIVINAIINLLVVIFTKRNERKIVLKQKKLECYDNLISAYESFKANSFVSKEDFLIALHRAYILSPKQVRQNLKYIAQKVDEGRTDFRILFTKLLAAFAEDNSKR